MSDILRGLINKEANQQKEPEDGGFFEDLYISMQQGFDAGFSVNEAFDVYKQGANISDEDLEAYINAVSRMDKSQKTNEQYLFQKAVEENGGGFFGGMKALYENPGYLPQLIVTSGATMLGSLIDSEEVAGFTAAGAGIGAASGSVVPLYGTVTGAVGGAFTGLVGAMETSLTLTDLLRDELGDKKFTKENIKDILENEEAVERLKNRSLARGMTIGMVEGLTLGLSRGVGGKVVRSIKRTGTKAGGVRTALAVGGATAPIEMVGGSTGEFLGQLAAGQEIKGEEIFLEGIAEGKGIVNVTDIISSAAKPTSYKMNGGFVSKSEIESVLNDKNLTPEELLNINIEVENDVNLQNRIKNSRARANIKKNIDKNITNDSDIDALVDLEIERRSLQDSKKDKKGAFKPLNLDKKIEDNQKKIDNILSKYEGVTAEDVKDVVGKAFILENYAADVAFAEKYSDIYDLTFNELKDNAAVEKYIKDNNLPEPQANDLRESSGLVNDVTGELIINKTKALEARNVNIGNHELLHAILRKAVRQGKISKKLISDLKTKIGSKNWSKIEQRIEDSGYNDPNLTGIVTKEQAELYGLDVNNLEFNENNEAEVSYMEANPDEYITQLSEAILEGDVKLDRSMLQKLADYFTPILRFMGFKNINFENANATLEFLREYHKSIKSNKLSKAIIKATASKRTNFVNRTTISETRKTGKGRKQIDKIKKDYETAKTPEEKLNIIQRFINNVYQGSEATQQEIDFFNNEIKALKKEGFELEMNFQPGTQLSEGDIVDITASIPDNTLPEGVTIVSRVSTPGIIKGGKKVNRTVVETRKGTKKSTKREALVKEVNRAQDMPGQGKNKLEAIKKARQALSDFDKQFQKTFNLADSKGKKSNIKRSLSSQAKQQISDNVQEIGDTYSFEGGKKAWDEGGADNAITEIKQNNYLDDLIAAKFKGDRVPVDFVDKVYTELTSHIRNFNPETNDNLFGWINSQIANKAGNVFNREYKTTTEQRTARDVDDRTKEGEVKVQVADETDTTLEALETEDISPQAEARRKREATKKEEPTKSELRQEIGIEDGSNAYNTILETARKVLIRAYDAGKTARQIQRDLTKEASIYLFKQVKNMLGTKNKYIPTIKKLRVALINSMFTSDLVQMERNVPDNERVFTKFVRKLTSKQEVQNAVDNNLLPPSALNTIDKGQSVNLYEKVMPTEEQFVAFFDQPLVNPKTGVRSGLRGTRKDQLAKYVAASLNFDATMQVAQEPEVMQKRKDIAEIKNQEIITDDIQQLSTVINRDLNLKFSRKNTENFSKKQKNQIKLGNKIILDIDKAVEINNIILKDGSQIPILQNLSEKDAEKYGGKFLINTVIDAFDTRGIERVDNVAVKKIIFKNILTPSGRLKKGAKFSTAYEQFFISLANSAVKELQANLDVNLVIKEGGFPDVGFQKGDIIIGLEIKMDQSRGVSYTYRFDDTISNENTQNQTEQKDLIKQIKSEIAGLPGITIEDLKRGVTPEQYMTLKANKSIFNKTVEVDAAYLEEHYTKKLKPEYFINIGDAGLFYMLGKEGDSNNIFVEKIAQELGIPRLQGKFQLNSVMNIGRKPRSTKGNTHDVTIRVQPRIDSKDVKNFPVKSNLNLSNKADMKAFVESVSKQINNFTVVKQSKSVRNARPVLKYSKKSRGMSAFDFDETLIDKGENFIIATSPDGDQVRISSGQWPIKGPELTEQGYTFDFKDFVNVRGGVDGPLLQKLKNRIKKYGAKNNYILTARPAESATAIHGWLKTKGINIPLENITGLGNSTGEAKAMWIAGKYSEGYNDIYFVDDALPNVKAVADVIDQLDIKGKSVQAKIKFSKSLNKNFNDIIEDVKGIDSKKRFSEAKGRARGKGKGIFRFFIPPSHEDFVGLLYNFIGFGEKGNKHRDFFEKALIKPLNRAFRELNVAKQAIANDYRALVKSMPEVRKRLGEKILKGDYTVEDAIRVYLFDKAGFEIPGLTKTDLKNLTDFVKENSDILQFADQVGKISRVEEGYVSPGDSWQGSNIRYDLVDATGRVGRAKFFTEFQENVDIIFSDENMNKIRAAFGDNFVEALQDMLYRIKTGNNRPTGNNRIVNKFLDWINGSVGATMFFNARSAVLQTLSTVNFINFGDNNIFKAAAAFANQKQFWSDFAALFNSDFLKQRRSGAAFDVNANEIAREVAGSKNPVLAAIKYLLNIGFLPTQLADSFAIASGGATFYRNRIKTYLKQGLSQKEAEAKAFIDFQEIAEATQQSARPDMVSQQQTSTLGRIILAFQNVTAQYARLIKKATLDLVNRRRSRSYQTQIQSDMSNISRIIYYGAIQAVIFNALQNALFAMMFDEEEEDEKKTEKFFDTKKQRVINGTIDSLLKGLGVGGAVVATLKNYAIKLSENLKDDSFFKTPAWEQLLQLSPPIGIKIRKIARAERNLEWNKDVLTELPLDNLDNPIYETSATYIEGFTNVPTARLLRKIQNLNAALDSENKWWQRIAVAAGWSRWDVGIQDNEMKEAKNAIRENNKRINKETKLKEATPEEKLKIVEKSVFDLNKNEQVKILEANNLNPKKYPKEADRVDAIMNLRNKNKRKIDSTITAIENYIPTKEEQRSIDLFKMNKKDQVNTLIDLGLSSKQIKELKYEEDRVNKIIELQDKNKSKKR